MAHDNALDPFNSFSDQSSCQSFNVLGFEHALSIEKVCKKFGRIVMQSLTNFRITYSRKNLSFRVNVTTFKREFYYQHIVKDMFDYF